MSPRWQSKVSLATLSNDDGDGNDNDKQAMGLNWQKKNNFARALGIFVHFFAVTARQRRETS